MTIKCHISSCACIWNSGFLIHELAREQYMWLFFQNVLHVLCTDRRLCWNKYHKLLRKMSRLSVSKQLFYRFGFQNVRTFAVTFTMYSEKFWMEKICLHWFPIINLFLFSVPMNFFWWKKENVSIEIPFHIYRFKLLFVTRYGTFLTKPHVFLLKIITKII